MRLDSAFMCLTGFDISSGLVTNDQALWPARV